MIQEKFMREAIRQAKKAEALMEVPIEMCIRDSIKTEMTGTVRQDWQDYWVSTIPFRRMGTPEELAGAVIYLLSDASTYTSGLDMIIDGCFTVV